MNATRGPKGPKDTGSVETDGLSSAAKEALGKLTEEVGGPGVPLEPVEKTRVRKIVADDQAKN